MAPAHITLSANSLSRRFGAQLAVDNLSLSLQRGEVLGLLGHNGAGKSTTLKMLTGCLRPDSGHVQLCGHDLQHASRQAKRHLGYLPETPPLHPELRVADFLTFAARLHGLSADAARNAVRETSQHCGLESVQRKVIATLSKGYQQRIGIAQAIVHNPEVIILDEPTVGLDPAQIRDIRQLIRELGQHASVMLSTHLLSEVESVCNRVEILQRGRLIYSDSSAGMQQRQQASGFILTLHQPPSLEVLRAVAGVTEVTALDAHSFRIRHTPEHNPSGELLNLAAAQGWQVEQLTPLRTSLEEVFVRLTSGENA